MDHPGIERIVAAIAHIYGVSRAELVSRCRTRTIAEARQVGMWAARELTGLSLAEVGTAFGRHHATVILAQRRVIEQPDAYARAKRVKSLARGVA